MFGDSHENYVFVLPWGIRIEIYFLPLNLSRKSWLICCKCTCFYVFLREQLCSSLHHSENGNRYQAF